MRLQDEIERWLNEAACELRITLRRLAEREASLIIDALQSRYIKGNPRAWWESLALPYSQFDSKAVRLSSVLPTLSENIYLIPESPKNNGPVYEVDAASLEALLNDCPYFEYSVTNGDRSWLLMESDHNIFFLCRLPPQHSQPPGCEVRPS